MIKIQKDFHYTLTCALAIKLDIAISNAETIAWANQFTDDCKDIKKYGIRTMCDIVLNSADCFVREVQLNVFVPFHFIPGDNNLFPLIVTPNSKLCRKILDKAIGYYEMGIALHALQDSFSHQSFTGLQENTNAKHSWDLTSVLAPRIGHAEFGHDPDIISETWKRNGKSIENRRRAEVAALCTWNALHQKRYNRAGDDTTIQRELLPLWNISDYDNRKEWLKNWAGGFCDYSIVADRVPFDDGIKNFVKAARKQLAIVQEYINKEI